jgi:sugar-phosphatase
MSPCQEHVNGSDAGPNPGLTSVASPRRARQTSEDSPRSTGVDRTIIHFVNVPGDRAERAVLLDVDGTLLDNLENLRSVWRQWATGHSLDPDATFQVALQNRPVDTFATLVPGLDPLACLQELHAIEDDDARFGDLQAHRGASPLLQALSPDRWALVTSNYTHRVKTRFKRLDLPVPPVLVDAADVEQGKPHPEGYLTAAEQLGIPPERCLVVEDSLSGIAAGRAAGMTVWAIGAGTSDQQEADRTYPALHLAVADILSWQAQ